MYNFRNDFENSNIYEKIENLVFTRNAIERFSYNRNLIWKVYDRSRDDKTIFVFESMDRDDPSQKYDVIRAVITPERYGIFLRMECGEPTDRRIFQIDNDNSETVYNSFFDKLFDYIIKKGEDGEGAVKFNKIPSNTYSIYSGIITSCNPTEYSPFIFANELHFDRIDPERNNIIIDSAAFTGLKADNRFVVCKVGKDGYIDHHSGKLFTPPEDIIRIADDFLKKEKVYPPDDF